MSVCGGKDENAVDPRGPYRGPGYTCRIKVVPKLPRRNKTAKVWILSPDARRGAAILTGEAAGRVLRRKSTRLLTSRSLPAQRLLGWVKSL